MYKCSKCKLSVIILPDKTMIKACTCDAPIIAEISSNVQANGGINIG